MTEWPLIHPSLDKDLPALYTGQTMETTIAFSLLVLMAAAMAMSCFSPRAWAAIRVRNRKQ